MQPYIYKITNLVNGKIYIGKSIGTLKYYFAGGKGINDARKKYGIKNFKKEIVVQGDFNNQLLNELERHYIQLYNSNNQTVGYNQTSGGDGTPNLSQEIIQRRVENFRGYRHTEEAKIKMSAVHKGKTISLEQILKIKQNRKIFTVSPEAVQRAVRSRRENGSYIWSEERRAKASEVRKGRIAPNAKPVEIFDLNGNFVAEYGSIKKAALDFFEYKCSEPLKVLLRDGHTECILRDYKVKLKNV